MNRHKLTAWFFALPLLLLSMVAMAAPQVEIIAMQHPPIVAALAPLRSWLAGQDGVKVMEIDIETAKGEERVNAVGLSGHIPLIILINGEFRHQREDGAPVAFVGFPDQDGSPPGVRGNWRIEDVQWIVREGR